MAHGLSTSSSSSQPSINFPIYRPHHEPPSSPFSPYHHPRPLFPLSPTPPPSFLSFTYFNQNKKTNHSPNSIMGFPSVCYCVILPKPLILAVQLLDRLKLAVAMILYYLGFTSLPEDYAYPLSATDFSVPASLPTTPSAIKSRIPVVKFSSSRWSSCQGEEPTCAVCLGELEGRHEVRKLGNCSHAFHKGCIDKWVDMGQVTCPLCRAQLLPKGRDEKGIAIHLM